MFLACALALLMCGWMVLRSSLRGPSLAAYWAICLIFAVLALLVVLMDLSA